MSTKFVVEGDVAQGQAALKAVAQDVKNVGTAADATGAEMDAAFDNANRIQDLKEEVDDLKEALRQAESQARETNAELGNPGAGKTGGDGTMKWTAMFTGITAGIEIAKKLGEAYRAVRGHIKAMADSGNLEFGKLNSQLDKMSATLGDVITRLSTSTDGQGALEFLTQGASKAGEYVAALGHVSVSWEEMFDNMRMQLADASGVEFFKENARAMSAQTQAIKKANEEAYDDEVKRQQLAKGRKLLDDFEAARAKEAAQADVDRIASIDEINAKIAEQSKEVEKLSQQGQLNDKVDREIREKRQQYENRRKQLVKELADAEKQAAEDTAEAKKQAAEEAAEFHKKQYDEQVEAVRKREADILAIEQAAMNQRLRMFAEYDAARKKQIDDLAGKADVKGAAGQLQAAASDPRAVAQRLAENAGATAGAQTRSTNPNASEEEITKAIADARRQAYRQATQQARGGFQAFSPEQISQAVSQNADAQLQVMQASGKVGQEMVDALGQNVQAMGQFAQEQAQHSQQIDQLMKMVGAMTSGSRSRAQAGAKKF